MGPLPQEGNVPSTQERVYERLRTMLRDQEIKPDARLNIAETASSLDASIIPTREAFARLSAEGLLERVPGSGFKVPGLSVANVEGDFTVVFLFLRHITDLYFSNEDAAAGILDQIRLKNNRLPDLFDDPEAISLEAERFVRDLLPFSNSAKLRSCVEAALDSSTPYRRVYYRETLDPTQYLAVRLAYEDALRSGDEAASREMVRVSQRDWEGKTRDLCRYAWIELFEN